MFKDISIPVSFPNDPSGYRHHECPSCEGFFKVKPGTGLPQTDLHCPYCDRKGPFKDFLTKEQLNYGRDLLVKEVMEQQIDPWIKEMEQLFQPHPYSLLHITLTGTRDPTPTPILGLSTEQLETFHTCDSCGLEFAIYGVFSHCPDCSTINAFGVFRRSVEVIKITLALLDQPLDDDLREKFLKDALGSGVAAFDGLGKELRRRYPAAFPPKPLNLFQNLTELEPLLVDKLSMDLQTCCSDGAHLSIMFQVRHLYEHNMGVIDERFVKSVPSFRHILGRKFPLQRADIDQFLLELQEVVVAMEAALK